jgi:multidrug resistance efflux pump
MIDSMSRAVNKLTEAYAEIETLRKTNALLLTELDEKDEQIKRLKMAVSIGLTISKSDQIQERARRVKELASRGLSSRAIEKQVFGYYGGYAWHFVKRVLTGSEVKV